MASADVFYIVPWFLSKINTNALLATKISVQFKADFMLLDFKAVYFCLGVNVLWQILCHFRKSLTCHLKYNDSILLSDFVGGNASKQCMSHSFLDLQRADSLQETTHTDENKQNKNKHS